MNLHDELKTQFNKVITQFKCDEILLTPFFNIGKNVPENLRQYKRMQNQKDRFFLQKYLFYYPFRLVLSVFRAPIHHIYWLNDYKEFHSQLPKFCNRIFISHFTGKVADLNESGRYFAELMPKRISKKDKKNLILLINHTRKLPKRDKKIKSRNNSIYIILPKTTNTKLVCKIYKKQIRNFFYILSELRKQNKISKADRVYLYELAIQQLSQSSLSQQFLFANLSYALKTGNLEELNLTYEGHSFETYIARKVDKLFRHIQINVYQFAPVVPSQISFYRNLERLPRRTKIYVTGKSIQRDIVQLTRISADNIHVRGSGKNKENVDIAELKKHQKFTILFAPEGLQDSFLEFVNLAGVCAKQLPNCRIVVRAHPDSLENDNRLLRNNLLMNSNALFSNASLKKDLSDSKICIYRSSSVGLQGLQYGVIPIHFSKLIDGSVDPIRIEDLRHLRCSESTSLISALKEYSMMSEIRFSKLQCGLPRVFEKYFERLSIN
jgi:hypothetical protein